MLFLSFQLLSLKRAAQALRAISCFRCKVLLHTDDECNFVQWDNEMCQELRMCVLAPNPSNAKVFF